MKILVAIPAYDRTIHVETARSLLNEQVAALSVGDEISTVFAPGCSLITYARNHLCREFLKSDAERMVFVDADVSWEVGSLLKIAHSPVDFVGGAYRYKDEKEGYPVNWVAKPELWSNELGLIEVAGLPGGFMSLSRRVFEVLKAKFPNRTYWNNDQEFEAYFHAPFRNGTLYGEDASFCAEWAEAGGQVWLDPELTLTHWEAGRGHTGHIGKWLKGRPVNLQISKALSIEGFMSEKDLEWLADQARKHKVIVEIGSYLGRSTRALGDNTHGKVFAVDDWHGPRDIHIPDEKRLTLYEKFCENMNGLREAGRVIPLKADHSAVPDIPEPVDMVFLDGSHEYEDVKRDIETWKPKIAPGGLLCGHDSNWPGVKKAIDELPGVKFVANSPLWYCEV